jgi:DNA-binding MarR family transcriptional regulator
MKLHPLDDNPTAAAFRALVRTYGLLGRIMQPYFAGFGISGAQWGVLRTLHRAETAQEAGLRLRDLSERLIVRPPSVTGVVNGLTRMGLVRCSTAPDDRRAKQVSLTSKGRRLLQRILDRHEGQIDTVLAGLNAKEQAQLQRLLQKLSGHLEHIAEPTVTTTADRRGPNSGDGT